MAAINEGDPITTYKSWDDPPSNLTILLLLFLYISVSWVFCIDVFFILKLLTICLMWDMALDYLTDMLGLQRGIIIHNG